MAIIQLKNVEVARVNQRGHGVQVVEKWQQAGKERSTRYTVWFDQAHGLNVGDRIDVSGFLGAKVGEPWTDREGQQRTSVELSVNSPRIGSQNAAQGQPEPVTPAPDSRGAFRSDETPF